MNSLFQLRLMIILRIISRGNGLSIILSLFFFFVGIPGYPGPRGPEGPPGRIGLNGNPGIKGFPGESGARGPRGWIGRPGDLGRDGVNGVPGWKGKDGKRGSRGAVGYSGLPGTDGRKGESGHRGETGGFSNLWYCNCEWNVPTQVFHSSKTSRVIFSFNDTTSRFRNLASVHGDFLVQAISPITYVLHIGGKCLPIIGYRFYIGFLCESFRGFFSQLYIHISSLGKLLHHRVGILRLIFVMIAGMYCTSILQKELLKDVMRLVKAQLHKVISKLILCLIHI